MINHRGHGEHGGGNLKDWREGLLPDRCGIIVDGDDVDRLVFTSVDDLRTQIKFCQRADSIHHPCLATLQVARQMCIDHGYKTKARILEAAIKRQEGAQ